MELISGIKKEIEHIREDLIDWRRQIHRHPETGFEEEKTSQMVRENLEDWGYRVSQVAGTGVVGLLEGKRPGKTIAIRADMDALNLEEKTGLEYSSEVPGKMHACGHDGHTAMALGAARVLAGFRDRLEGNVKFLFQPAEEGPGGAQPMIEEGVLENPRVDNILGLHIRTDIPSGQIGIASGPIMAAPDQFSLTIKGEGTHGAHPDQGVDPIVVSSHVILALQDLVSREIDPTEPMVITTGEIHGGTAFNVIPDQVELKGTVRTLNPELREWVRNRMEELIHGITGAMGADYELDYKFEYPVTINNPRITDLMEGVIEEMLGTDGVYQIEKPSMGGEDFAYFLQEVPGTFVLLGTRNPEKGVVYPGHSPKFRIDEDILPIGVEFFCRGVLKLLSGQDS